MRIDDTSRYLPLVRERPRPTTRQMRAFARFLAGDHSWYKKLPLRGSGEPFFIYLDPEVHMARVHTETGATVAREVTRQPDERNFYMCRIDLQPGDLDPGAVGPLNYLFSKTSTAEYRERYGYWSYWNWGPPDQPQGAALALAADQLRVCGEDLEPIPVPDELLELGLVYLRATISGHLGPTEDEYERLRETEQLPDPYEDQLAQLLELETAMERIANQIYD
jgi:hypothetical protein